MAEFLGQHTESFFWVAAQLAVGLLGISLWPQFKTIFASAAGLQAEAGRLAHSLAIPYLALLIGSVSARDTGLIGAEALPYSLTDWARALLWASAFGGAALAMRVWLRRESDVPPAQAWLDEVRWAFYRGAAIGWIGLLGGVALGAGLAALEWAVLKGLRTSWAKSSSARLNALLRLALSAAVFAITQNVWATWAAGALVAFGLARWSAPRG